MRARGPVASPKTRQLAAPGAARSLPQWPGVAPTAGARCCCCCCCRPTRSLSGCLRGGLGGSSSSGDTPWPAPAAVGRGSDACTALCSSQPIAPAAEGWVGGVGWGGVDGLFGTAPASSIHAGRRPQCSKLGTGRASPSRPSAAQRTQHCALLCQQPLQRVCPPGGLRRRLQLLDAPLEPQAQALRGMHSARGRPSSPAKSACHVGPNYCVY